MGANEKNTGGESHSMIEDELAAEVESLRARLIREIEHREEVGAPPPTRRVSHWSWLFFAILLAAIGTFACVVAYRIGGVAGVAIISVLFFVYAAVGGAPAWTSGIANARQERDIERRVDEFLQREAVRRRTDGK